MTKLLHFLLFLPAQGSTFAKRSDALHYFIILTTLVVAFAIGTVGLIFLIRFRARTPEATTRKIVGPMWLEGLFVGIPLAFFLLWFFIGYRDYTSTRNAPPDSLDIYVTAKQWMWKFTYPEGPSSIGTLHIPAGRPIRLLLTSRDVIHSFFVPAFRMKQDAIPGTYTEITFTAEHPGTFLLECAEYCGLNHSNMLGSVVALEPEAYRAWIEEQARGIASRQDTHPLHDSTDQDLRAEGARVAQRAGCLKCHTLDGTPHIGPTWLDLYRRTERLSDGSTVVADEAYLTESMMLPGAKIVAGFQPVMPSFQGRLQPGEIAALVELIKSLRSARVPTETSQEPAYVPR